MGDLKVTSAAERRRKSSFLFEASEGFVVRIRKMEMTDLILNNLIPMPMLKAAQRYQELQTNINALEENKSDLSDMEKLEVLNQELNSGVLDGWRKFLKRYVIAVVMEPKIVDPEELGRPPLDEELSVHELTTQELLAILNSKEETAEGGPRLTSEQAEEFRRPEQPVDDHAAPGGPEVRAETQLLDTPARECVHA